MRTRRPWAFGVAALAAAACLGAASCGDSNGSHFLSNDDGGAAGPGADRDAGSVADALPSLGSPDGGGVVREASVGPAVSIVYAHSADTLYKLDPTTKAVDVVGTFKGCTSVIDIALDASSNAVVTTSGAFYALDLATATCTHVASGSYPNSLSFVPKGTLDPNAEALVGYFGAKYVRIDTKTGAVSTIGGLTGGYASSGDIVSVEGGGTFLTVNGNGCGDCLLQIDPKTGDLVQNYGDVKHAAVYGLAFWAGTVYGFDDAGEVFSVGVQNGMVVTSDIPVPNPPPALSFWGAGSTTSAPVVNADGGGIPIK